MMRQHQSFLDHGLACKRRRAVRSTIPEVDRIFIMLAARIARIALYVRHHRPVPATPVRNLPVRRPAGLLAHRAARTIRRKRSARPPRRTPVQLVPVKKVNRLPNVRLRATPVRLGEGRRIRTIFQFLQRSLQADARSIRN
jgi:hypothetical protein